MKKILPILLFLVLAVPIQAQLKLNELMVKNVSAVMDDSFNYSMWIEVYNPDTKVINLGDYFFTDKISEPKKWKTNKISLPPKSYHVLWFEREEIEGHANFKLDPEGGKLYLMDYMGNIVDQVNYPKQYRNISYGRIDDNKNEWSFFMDHSFGKSNKNGTPISSVCSTPVFQTKAGFYEENVQVKFQTPIDDEIIYYTINGSEPTQKSRRYVPETEIDLDETTIIRAASFSENKIPSEIITNTFFVNERNFSLPVVSIVSDENNLYDPEIGIYVEGNNGKVNSTCDSEPKNYNQDWDRAANFEYFDENGNISITQELDIAIAGGCSRSHPQKSLKINPKKKYGNNKLNYNFFQNTRPQKQYKSLLYRNSGNDFTSTMMRDGFMQTLIMNRLDVEYQSYQPTVCFINGEYQGIQNLRERSNKDLIYTIYGLKEEDIRLIDEKEIPFDTEFQSMVSYAKNNDIADIEVYEEVKNMIDVDSYLNYIISQIYFNNGDWPHNNMKMWKEKKNGKWRPILFDTDFGWGLFGLPHSKTKNAIEYALSENLYRERALENIYMLRRLMENPIFEQKFINRFCIHISSTFETQRSLSIMDSIANLIRDEMIFHKKRYGSSITSFNSSFKKMETFANERPSIMLKYISDYFFSGKNNQVISISSNIGCATYLFGDEVIMDDLIDLNYFKGELVEIKANPVENYKFNHWELTNSDDKKVTYINSDTYSNFLNRNINIKAIYEYNPGTAIPIIKEDPISIYPKFTNSYVTIKYAKGKMVRIYDMVGNCKYNKCINNEEENINVSFFSAGIYIIKIENKTYKIIKS